MNQQYRAGLLNSHAGGPGFESLRAHHQNFVCNRFCPLLVLCLMSDCLTTVGHLLQSSD
jgi:hypothetical protein